MKRSSALLLRTAAIIVCTIAIPGAGAVLGQMPAGPAGEDANALSNGDFHEWKNYKGGITTESVGTPPASLPTHWYGGPGVGAIATYDRIKMSLENPGRAGDRWAMRVAW